MNADRQFKDGVRLHRISALVLVVVITHSSCVLSAARADTSVWTGASSSNWSDHGNWQPSYPTLGSSVEFTGINEGVTYGTIVNAPFTIQNLIIVPGTIYGNEDSNYDIDSSGTGSLSISSGISDTMPYADLGQGDQINAPVFVIGNNTWTVGNGSQLDLFGSLNLEANLTTTGSGNLGYLSINSNISGNGAITDQSGRLLINGSSNTYNGGTNVDEGASLIVYSALGTGPVSNAGFLLYEQGTAGSTSISNSGQLEFHLAGTAGSATIANNSGGQILVENNGTAGQATITNNAGGQIFFQDNATAAQATIVNKSYGYNDSNNGIDLSAMTTGLSIGSLSGNGTVYLGANTLTLGGLNGNDTITGAIYDTASGDGGVGTGGNGNLVKIGSGTLTLSAASVITGTTTVNSGTLVLTGLGHYATVISNSPGAVVDIMNGEIAYSRSLNGGTTNISGGLVLLADTDVNSTLNITGGEVDKVILGDPSSVNIYGGQFSGSITNDDPTGSLVNIFGSDLSLSDPTLTNNGADVDWLLTGVLADGETLDTTYVESDNDVSSAQGITLNNGASAPEPSALALLFLTGIPALATFRLRRRDLACYLATH